MSIYNEFNNDSAIIHIADHFTFNDSGAFHQCLSQIFARNAQQLTIDLSRLRFMDSSAIGMMIVTDTECAKHEIRLQFSNPQGEVKKILQLTRLYERFNIIES
jgi:HptB-dependent secretion and biofilm anti anti-sigma factor